MRKIVTIRKKNRTHIVRNDKIGAKYTRLTCNYKRQKTSAEENAQRTSYAKRI